MGAAGALAVLDDLIADMGDTPGTTGHQVARVRDAVAELIEALKLADAMLSGERKANARLIDVAPEGLAAGVDLLGVVKAAIRTGDWRVDGACDPDAAIRRMESFIDKATGAHP